MVGNKAPSIVSRSMRTIALLTDFGTRDPYVAAMKGVIASRCEVLTSPTSRTTSRRSMFGRRRSSCATSFATGRRETIFVCVVIRASELRGGSSGRIGRTDLSRAGQRAAAFRPRDAYDVTDESLFLSDGSTTFHGRDRFAPVAAALANGTRIEDLGPRVDDRVPLDYTPGASFASIDSATASRISFRPLRPSR